MKKLSLFMAVASVATAATAADYPYLILRQKDGTEYCLKSDDLRFRVADGKLIVTQGGENSSFTLSELASMEFSATQSGLEAVTVTDDSAVEVYSTSGAHIGSFQSIDAARKGIPASGVYVLSSKNGSAKILIEK